MSALVRHLLAALRNIPNVVGAVQDYSTSAAFLLLFLNATPVLLVGEDLLLNLLMFYEFACVYLCCSELSSLAHFTIQPNNLVTVLYIPHTY